jgi:proteic killer suppression protein
MINAAFAGIWCAGSDAFSPPLISSPGIGGLSGPPGWRIHQLSRDRAGTWSISVSGNWRITFDLEGDLILNLDLEDYH